MVLGHWFLCCYLRRVAAALSKIADRCRRCACKLKSEFSEAMEVPFQDHVTGYEPDRKSRYSSESSSLFIKKRINMYLAFDRHIIGTGSPLKAHAFFWKSRVPYIAYERL